MEQDDEYLLYHELQELSNGHERFELSKILEDDDCDEVDHLDGLDADSLDCLRLPSIIETFGDFNTTSLIDSQTNVESSDNQIDQYQQTQTHHHQQHYADSCSEGNNSIRSRPGHRNHFKRRTANARERIRMREINQAFEELKKVVPAELFRQAIQESEEASDQASGRQKSSLSQSDSIKLTKITTLRLAVSYIAKLTEILKQSHENPPAKVGQPTKAEGKKSKTDRQSRKTRTVGKKRVQNTKSKAAQSAVSFPNQSGDYLPSNNDDNQSLRTQPPVLIANNQLNNDLYQQPSQTALISIPTQQRPQYLTAQPSQQQMLIPQPMTGSTERQMVTPVAVAILGIPTGTNQMTNANNPRGVQFLTLQKSQQQVAPVIQQQPTYNLQLSQVQQQNRAPQLVTLTFDDLNGLSVLRLSNPQFQKSVPVHIKTTNDQLAPSNQQTQIFTASNGLNYAIRSMPTSQQLDNTNLIANMGETTPKTSQQSTFQVCNINNINNLITPNDHSNNNISNNIIQAISSNYSSSSISGHQQQFIRLNGQTMCNINQIGRLPDQGAQGNNASSEANITQLVASLATSIQPPAQVKTLSNVPRTKISPDPRKSQQSQQQQQQPQAQPVRTYRFHNYDGDMINNHLYGGNISDKQQAGQQQKRNQAVKQLQESMHRIVEQPAMIHRSRQNSLSSICSTTSCSSSPPNSTSSASSSPANHPFVMIKLPQPDSNNCSNNS